MTVPAPERSLELAAGVVVAKRYTLQHELGRGAAGAVWEAEHNLLLSRVAIKFLHATSLATEAQIDTLLERFRFEAQISARLAAVTDRIVAVHDAGLFRGVPFIVMELAPGETLDDAIQRAPLPPKEVARVLDQLAEAVDAAHRAGLAHRDIKPANVLCQSGDRGGYKLADFGVAKLFRDTSLKLDSPKQTTANVLVGSPAYMCPEYVSGTPTTNGAGDLWAMAVLAYEALTQMLPFDGEAFMQVAMAIVAGRFVPPSHRVGGLGPEIDAFFVRALSLDPAARFSTAGDLARAFRAALEANATPAAVRAPATSSVEPILDEGAPARRPPGRALLLAGLGLAVALGVAGVWRVFLSGAESAAAPARPAPEAPASSTAVAPSPSPPRTVDPQPTSDAIDLADIPSAAPSHVPSPEPSARPKPSSSQPADEPSAPRRPVRKPDPSDVL